LSSSPFPADSRVQVGRAPKDRAGERVKERRAQAAGTPEAPGPDRHKWVVAVDCDGVLHSYRSGWQGADSLPDPPVPGAIEWLELITKTFEVAINSTRCRSVAGRWAIEAWLREHGLSDEALARVHYPPYKPAALVYLDDRALRFDGEHFPSVADVWAAKPWGVAARLAPAE
jgi:hypothetical protein